MRRRIGRLARAASELVHRTVGATTSTLTVAAEPDAALLASAAALRRLGGRILRYDAEQGTLEARLEEATVRVSVAPAAADAARLELATDARRARRLVRRFRGALARPASNATP